MTLYIYQDLSHFFPPVFLFKNIYLFIWLHLVLVLVRTMSVAVFGFSCPMACGILIP